MCICRDCKNFEGHGHSGHLIFRKCKKKCVIMFNFVTGFITINVNNCISRKMQDYFNCNCQNCREKRKKEKKRERKQRKTIKLMDFLN